MPSNVGSPVQPCPNKQPAQDPVDPNKKWIKFQVKDNDGALVPNVRVTVVLPDGSREEHVSDKDGMIEINNMEEGACRIETDWRNTHVARTMHGR